MEGTGLHIVRKGRFELEGSRLVVFSPRLAMKVNRLLKHYPLEYHFKAGEEPLFKVPQNELKLVLYRLLRLKINDREVMARVS